MFFSSPHLRDSNISHAPLQQSYMSFPCTTVILHCVRRMAFSVKSWALLSGTISPCLIISGIMNYFSSTKRYTGHTKLVDRSLEPDYIEFAVLWTYFFRPKHTTIYQEKKHTTIYSSRTRLYRIQKRRVCGLLVSGRCPCTSFVSSFDAWIRKSPFCPVYGLWLFQWNFSGEKMGTTFWHMEHCLVVWRRLKCCIQIYINTAVPTSSFLYTNYF